MLLYFWHFDLLLIIHIYVYIINISIHCGQVPACKGTLSAGTHALLSSFLLQWGKLGITSNSVQADIPLCSKSVRSFRTKLTCTSWLELQFMESQNTSNDEDPQLLWTTCSTTIIVKNVSLMPSINLASFSLKPLPLVLSVLGKVSFHASNKLLLYIKRPQ